MHMRHEDGWVVFYAEDQETEVWRMKLPEQFTMAELEQFIEHLKREAAKRAAGPS